jgi:creatinine amidohydrolase
VRAYELASLTSPELATFLQQANTCALVSAGSVEPHGPHLPLETDAIINWSCMQHAAKMLAQAGVPTLLAPAIPYGVTEFAKGFAGALSLPEATLVSMLQGVSGALLECGFSVVCLVTNHLEPGQYQAVLKAALGMPRVTVACPLARRWGRTLTSEFKKGECHAGTYETSIVLAAEPALVRASYAALPEVPVSLSAGIAAGKHSFVELGMTEAYAGAPASATSAEGAASIALLANMVVTEVQECLARCG